ncbi:MAG: hypothetical protein LUI14_13485 [Lachnospiraceae bacterium]|nr:hypothetical protein [Lachnospiraceae bacterium]
MSEEKDIEIVKKILDCEERLSSANDELGKIRNTSYSEKKPAEPVRMSDDKLAPPIPPLKSDKKKAFGPYIVCVVLSVVGTIFHIGFITSLMTFLTFLAIIWIAVYFVRLSKERKQHADTVRNSPAYKTQWENAKKQEDERYKIAVKYYEETTYPQWKEKYDIWKKEYDEKYSTAWNKVTALQAERRQLYSSYPQIPVWCQSKSAMVFLETIMSMYNCDLNYAIAKYRDKLEAEEREKARREAEREARLQREAEESYSDQGGSFIRDVAAVGLGVAAGNKISGVGGKKDNSSSREKAAAYTCSPSCPRKGKGYGKSRCELNPNTCGYGLRYTDDTLLRSRR